MRRSQNGIEKPLSREERFGYEGMAMNCPFCQAASHDNANYCWKCGTVISQKPFEDQRYVEVPERPFLRVNGLCLVGAIVAALALFLPWAVSQDQVSHVETNIGAFDFDDAVPGISSIPEGLRNSVTIFLIGTALAFFSPLSGIPLLTGSVGFMLTAMTTRFENSELTISLGALAAVVSSIIVLWSLVYPAGPGYSHGRAHELTSKLLTWGVFKVGGMTLKCPNPECKSYVYVGHGFCGDCGARVRLKTTAIPPQ